MSTCTILCDKTFTYCNTGKTNLSQGQLYVGNRNGYSYWSYIYFPIDQIPECRFITKAKIVLFSIPEYRTQTGFIDYFIAPTTYFYTNNTVLSEEAFQKTEGIIFQSQCPVESLELDITTLVQKWYKNQYTNYGFVLMNLGVTGFERFYGKDHLVQYPMVIVEFRGINEIIPVCQESKVVLPTSVTIDYKKR